MIGELGMESVDFLNFLDAAIKEGLRQLESVTYEPARPAFRMHERLEHFIAVFEIQFLIDILEVDDSARKPEPDAVSRVKL